MDLLQIRFPHFALPSCGKGGMDAKKRRLEFFEDGSSSYRWSAAGPWQSFGVTARG